jgi:hypothetical protein
MGLYLIASAGITVVKIKHILGYFLDPRPIV